MSPATRSRPTAPEPPPPAEAALDQLTFGATERVPAPRATFERILACHDGSPRSGKVVEWAQHVARLHHAKVIVASIAPAPNAAFYTPLLGGYYADVTADYARAEESLREIAEDAAAMLRDRGVDAEGVSFSGSPARELANVARTHHADLVILGAHGGGGVSRVLLGSVAESLAGSVEASILVARAPPPVARILVATDGSAASQRALAVALRYADATGAEVVVQHVLDVADEVPRPHEGFLKQVVERMQLASQPRISYVLDAGPPARRIVDRAASERCDLIVVGARGLGRVQGALLGSVSHRVVNTTGASVLVVREA